MAKKWQLFCGKLISGWKCTPLNAQKVSKSVLLCLVSSWALYLCIQAGWVMRQRILYKGSKYRCISYLQFYIVYTGKRYIRWPNYYGKLPYSKSSQSKKQLLKTKRLIITKCWNELYNYLKLRAWNLWGRYLFGWQFLFSIWVFSSGYYSQK